MSASDVLAGSGPECDPDREGIRILMACAVSVLPSLSLDELVAVAPAIFPDLGCFDPAMIADVAAHMKAA